MKKKHIIISGIALFLITILLLGLTYAYYKTKVIGNTNEKTISSVGKKLEVTYTDGNGVIKPTGKIEPGYTVTKTFSVKNTGDDTATYSIKLDNITNTFSRAEDWTYVLKEGNTELSTGIIPTYETTLLDSIEIESGATKSYSLVVTYANLSDVDQSIDMGATLSIRVNIGDEVKNSVTFIGNGNALENYRIYGNSIQRGIPTPDNPVEIESVGDKTKNLFDPNILIEQGWTKEEDGSYYIENNRTIYKKKLWKNTEGYTGQIRVNYKVKYLKGYEESIAQGSIIRIVYTDGTLKSVAFISGKWSKEWQDVNWNTISDADKIVEYIDWIYGTGDNSTWVKDIMITKDVESDEYEPYGYKIPVTVSGKNLLNSSVTEKTLNGVTLKNENGKITLNGTCTESANFEMNYINLPEGTYTLKANASGVPVNNIYAFVQLWDAKNEQQFWISNDLALRSTTRTVKISAKFLYRIRIEKGVTYDNLTLSPQLESGNTATEYEPYVEPITTNIYLDEPLRKIGNYADYIDFKEKKVVRYIFKHVLTGDELVQKIGKDYDWSDNSYFIFYDDTLFKGGLCNYYLVTSNKYYDKGLYLNSSALAIFKDSSVSSAEELNTFFKEKYTLNNPVTFIVPMLYRDSKKVKMTTEEVLLPSINTLNGFNTLKVDTNLKASDIQVNN